jgi:two-component system cell cycle response regulator DivK
MAATILIVEDNEKNRRLIKDVLEYHGYLVIEAPNGAEGARLAIERKPDLILMDIQMPVMDGMSAAKLIRSDPAMQGIRMIALTSFAMKGDRERFLEAGFDDYLAKPVDTRKLPGIVKKHLANPRSGGPVATEPNG